MSATVTIPVLEDEHIWNAGEVDFVRGLLRVGDYIYSCTDHLISPAKIAKIHKDNFSDRSTAAFTNDDKHDRATDLIYVPETGLIYVLFIADGIYISSVDPTTLARVNVVSDASSPSVGNGTLTSDGTYLYVMSLGVGSESTIAKYALSGFARTLIPLTGYLNGSVIRYSGGSLYATGSARVGFDEQWVLKLSTTGTVQASVNFANTSFVGEGITNLIVEAGYVFIAYQQASGNVTRLKLDLTEPSVIPTGIQANVSCVAYDGLFVWVLFNNGRAVRIHPTTLAQDVYTLNEGQGYLSELIGDGNYLYATRFQAGTVITKYRIPAGEAEFKWKVVNLSGSPTVPEIFQHLALDASNNVLTLGSAENAPYITKYDSATGAILAQRIIGGIANLGGIAVDSTGDVFVAVSYKGGSIDLGGGPLPGVFSAYNIAVAKYTPSGSNFVHVWSKSFYGGDLLKGSFCYGLTLDPSGHPVITGACSVCDFGDGNITNGPASGVAFVASVKSDDGSHRYHQLFSTADVGVANAIKIDSLGAIYLTGWFNKSIDFGGGNVLTAPAFKSYLVKLNSARTYQWHKVLGEFASVDQNAPFTQLGGRALAIAPNGHVIVALAHIGTINLGGVNIVAHPNSQGNIAFGRFNSAGDHQWSQGISSNLTSTGIPYGAGVDSGGAMLFTGLCYGNADFGGGPRPATVVPSFIVKYSADGAHLWDRTYPTRKYGLAITADAQNNVIHCGAWFDTSNGVDFGDGVPVMSQGGIDPYLVKNGP